MLCENCIFNLTKSTWNNCAMHMLTFVHTCVLFQACVKKMDFRIRNEYLYFNGRRHSHRPQYCINVKTIAIYTHCWGNCRTKYCFFRHTHCNYNVLLIEVSWWWKHYMYYDNYLQGKFVLFYTFVGRNDRILITTLN